MLGLPKELTEHKIQRRANTVELTVSTVPTLLRISRLMELPDDLEEKERYATQFPRFIGRLSDDCPLNDIKGMSGGQIFCCNADFNHYRVIAIQSKILDRYKIIFGGYIQLLGATSETALGMLSNPSSSINNKTQN